MSNVCKVSQGKIVHQHVLILRTEGIVKNCVTAAKIYAMFSQGVNVLPQVRRREASTQLKPLQRNTLNCLEVCALYRKCRDSSDEREIWWTVTFYERCLTLRVALRDQYVLKTGSSCVVFM